MPPLRTVLRVATIGFGALSLSLMAFNEEFISWPGSFHRWFLFGVTISAFAVSAPFVCLSNTTIIHSWKHWNIFDAGIHAILGTFLAIGWFVYLGLMLDLTIFGPFVGPMLQTWLAWGVLVPEFFNIGACIGIAVLAGKAPTQEDRADEGRAEEDRRNLIDDTDP